MSRAKVQFLYLPPKLNNMIKCNPTEQMSKRDAEIAVAVQISNENPGMLTNEQAIKIGEDFIHDVKFAAVQVETDTRKGKYLKTDRRSFDVCF